MFGCNNDRLFAEKYTVKDHISSTKLEKGEKKYVTDEKIFAVLFALNQLQEFLQNFLPFLPFFLGTSLCSEFG